MDLRTKIPFWVIIQAILFLPPACFGQGIEPPSCKATDLDITIETPNHSVSPTSMVFYLRNISRGPCLLLGEPGFGFMNDKSRSVTIANTKSTKRTYRSLKPRQLTLAPGAVAEVSLGFFAKPHHSVECQNVSVVSFYSSYTNTNGASNGANVILHPMPVCSVDVSPYTLASHQGSYSRQKDLLLEISSDRATYYGSERIPIKVTAKGPKDLLAVDKRSCLPLFQRSRFPNGFTRFDDVGGLARSCKANTSGAGVTVEMFVQGSYLTGGGLGQYSVDVAYLSANGTNAGVSLAKSNTLHFEIQDSAILVRKWGPPTKRAAVDVTLLKDVYAIGEDISLLIALKNTAAGTPVYGFGYAGCDIIVNLEVRDAADGTLVKKLDDKFCARISSGLTFPGVVTLPLSQLLTQERTLGDANLLPDHAGSFTVSATWNIYDCERCPDNAEPVAVARSGPRAFRILGAEHSSPLLPAASSR